MSIKFGTDGWRAIAGEDYTVENVRLCAQGTAAFLLEQGVAARGLVVGYDTRHGSEEFAAAVAEVTCANSVPTFLCDRPAPTPVISYNLVAREAGGAAIITASHNPAQWNGYKYKPHYGGSASTTVVEQLERHIGAAESSGAVHRMPLEEAQAQGLLEYIDPEPVYLGHVAGLVDLGEIRAAGLKVVVDSMFGAGSGYLAKLLAGGTTEVTELNAERDPAFPGILQPEPIAQNLGRLMTTVPAMEADVGLATDGDADRLGVVDETGRFVTTLHTFALLSLHLLEFLGLRGPLVRSITMTSMIDRLGAIYDVPVFDTPVGFKHLGPVMIAEEAIAAGEESGGYAFRGHIPERDGILSALMLLDMMVKTGKSLSELLEVLAEKVGPHFYDREDLSFDEEERGDIEARVRAARPTSLGGREVEGTDDQDGVRFLLEGGYWALIRFSGTEPLLRIYAEGHSPDQVADILDEARTLAGL